MARVAKSASSYEHQLSMVGFVGLENHSLTLEYLVIYKINHSMLQHLRGFSKSLNSCRMRGIELS